jgi:hypothetical protein
MGVLGLHTAWQSKSIATHDIDVRNVYWEFAMKGNFTGSN